MTRKIVLTSLLLLIWSTALAATTFVADTAHSTVGFTVPIAGGLSKVTGKFSQFTVNINYDEKDITKSSVEAVIKAESISTGITGRDNHLRTPDFFDVAKYPEITFKSKRVVRKGKSLMLTGDFSMHGVTKELTFPFTVQGTCIDAATKAPKPCGFLAKLTLDRREYGVAYERKNDPQFIGHLVEIELNILATQPRPAR